ncbi:MAG: hypothetical protein AAFS11_01210 [Planctomycetota bacterium]
MKHRWTRRCGAITASFVLGAAALTALPAGDAGAQAQQSLKPPSVNQTEDPPTIRMYLVTALLGALVVGANLIPSKRGHQD